MILARFFGLTFLTFFLNELVRMSLYFGHEWYAFVTLPGTFLHEAAHYIFAWALDGDPGEFSIVPTYNLAGKMETMGHITFYPNSYNAALVGLAPLLLIPLGALFIAMAARSTNLLKIILWCFMAVCAWHSCRPSRADLDVHGFIGSYLYAAPVLVIAAWLTYKVTRYILKI